MGVARGGLRDLNVNHPTVLVQVPLDIAQPIGFARDKAAVGFFGDGPVLRVGEPGNTLANDLLRPPSDHLAKRVVGGEHLVFEVDKDHPGHIVLEREPKALFAARERFGSGELGDYGAQLNLGANILRCSLGAVVADCHDGPVLSVKIDRRDSRVDLELFAVAA